MSLKRLVLEFRDGELIARVLYRSSLDGPNPSTKARAREVTALARSGLTRALEALESEAEAAPVSVYIESTAS